MNPDEACRDDVDRTVLWVAGVMPQLIERGYVDPISFNHTLTMKGTALCDQLDAGFKPDDLQLAQCADNMFCANSAQAAWILRKFRDNPRAFDATPEEWRDPDATPEA